MKNILVLILLTTAGSIYSQEKNAAGRHLNLEKGIALEGYDLITYFTGKPLKGKDTISTNYGGAKYLFSSQENKQVFIDQPTKYLPAYGGWCAYAIGESGKKVKIDPMTYKINNGVLYLFYNFNKINTLDLWNKDEDHLTEAADTNWQEIIQ